MVVHSTRQRLKGHLKLSGSLILASNLDLNKDGQLSAIKKAFESKGAGCEDWLALYSLLALNALPGPFLVIIFRGRTVFQGEEPLVVADPWIKTRHVRRCELLCSFP